MGYSLDGQSNVTITGNITLAGLADGFHLVVVYATDAYGNTGSASRDFTVDTILPVVTISSPLNTTYSVDAVDLNFTLSEAVVWIGYSLDGSALLTNYS